MKIRLIMVMFILLINCNLFAGAPPQTEVYLANFSGSDLRFKINYNFNYEHDYRLFTYGNEITTLTGEFCNTILTDERYYDMDLNNIFFMIGTSDRIENIEYFLHNYIISLDIYNSAKQKIYSFNNMENLKIVTNRVYYDFGPEDEYCDIHYIIIEKLINSSKNYPYITSDNLNLREYGRLNSSVLAMLKKGEEIKIISVGFQEKIKVENIYNKKNFPKNNIVTHFWVEVETKSGLVGWCYSYYLKAKNGT